MKKKNLLGLTRVLNKLFLVICLISVSQAFSQEKFKSGDEVLLENVDFLLGKNVALITNKSALLPNGTHIIDALLDKGVKIIKIFTPEHGFTIDDLYKETKYNIEVISLYNEKKTFSANDIQDVDILIFDIQDLGVRCYTYVSTLYLTMKSASEYNIPYILCDRASIANLNYVSGYNLYNKFKSFVGMVPVPLIYGMTIGELGNLIRNSDEIKNLNFQIMKLEGYNRETDYRNLYKQWIDLSPSITSLESGRIYPALVFLEGTNISEGRGTNIPFQIFGAPFCKSEDIIDRLGNYNFKSVKFSSLKFKPERLNLSVPPKYCDEECNGVEIDILDEQDFKPMELSIAILVTLKELYPEFKWNNGFIIDKLAGTDVLRTMIDNGKSYQEIVNSYLKDVEDFKKEREKFLVY